MRGGQGTYAAGLPVRTGAPPLPKPPSRHISQDVKTAVEFRVGGKGCLCGSTEALQYDHIFPWSRGGSLTDPDNIQLLCGYHNRLKRDLLSRWWRGLCSVDRDIVSPRPHVAKVRPWWRRVFGG